MQHLHLSFDTRYIYFIFNEAAITGLHSPLKFCRKLTITLLKDIKFPCYEMIEKFDDIILNRSCPSAFWNPVLPRNRWTECTHLSYEPHSVGAKCRAR
jgi:hypothetical protein